MSQDPAQKDLELIRLGVRITLTIAQPILRLGLNVNWISRLSAWTAGEPVFRSSPCFRVMGEPPEE